MANNPEPSKADSKPEAKQAHAKRRQAERSGDFLDDLALDGKANQGI
ncbi:MAG: hypothetical protein KGH63_03475 [Candidatus Micrarchaeota archaeon]|nr:hypothetical protein [Candidatus Micrarchaeota archaeon]